MLRILKMLMFLASVSIIHHVTDATPIVADSQSFAEFMTTYNKEYNGDKDEFDKRFEIWKSNIDTIKRHNLEYYIGHHTYLMDINQFGDLTFEEYQQTLNFFQTIPEEDRIYGDVDTSMTSLPDKVDWRAEGYVTEVGNQGQCGSCWAFTATGALEGQHKKKTGQLVDLSEQNLMDCSAKEGNLGCSGGMMDYSFQYVKDNGGIDTEQYYPYNLSHPGTFQCKYSPAQSGATCSGFVDLPKGNETALQMAVAKIGPIAGAVDATHQSFQFYKSGVWSEPECHPDQLCHSLLVVGYGTLNGVDYYDCKNSWGTDWGDAGFVKIARNKNNQCGIATMASYPTV